MASTFTQLFEELKTESVRGSKLSAVSKKYKKGRTKILPKG